MYVLQVVEEAKCLQRVIPRLWETPVSVVLLVTEEVSVPSALSTQLLVVKLPPMTASKKGNLLLRSPKLKLLPRCSKLVVMIAVPWVCLPLVQAKLAPPERNMMCPKMSTEVRKAVKVVP